MRSLDVLKKDQGKLQKQLNEVNRLIREIENDNFKEKHGFGVGDIIEYQNGSRSRIQRMRVIKIKGGLTWWADGRAILKDGTEGRNRAWTMESYGKPKLIKS